MSDHRSEKLLSQINSRIPAGVDWKLGALNYLDNLFVGEQKDSMIRFHLTKPFVSLHKPNSIINEQLKEFTREIGFFANLLATLNLPASASFLDVACGTGWVSHYLGKLGLQVTGFDISEAMIALAEQRISADPWPTTTGEPPKIDFFVHDIEESPLPTTDRFDVAILESALHHFVDPVKVLSHIRKNLTKNGIVIIIEGSSDGQDSHCKEVMEKYDTLERPYTPEELGEIINCAGFPSHRRMVPISGFFHPGFTTLRRVQGLLCEDRSWNTFIAFNSHDAQSLVFLQGAEEPIEYLVDATGDLVEDLETEHWIGPSSRLLLNRPDQQMCEIVFRTPLPNLSGHPTRVVLIDCLTESSIYQFTILPRQDQDGEIRLLLPLHEGKANVELFCSGLFSPSWIFESDDYRLLSGRVMLSNSSARPQHTITRLDDPDHRGMISDYWMGPDARLYPIVDDDGTVKLLFTSPLPRRRFQTQLVWVTVEQSGKVYTVRLRPSINRESSSLLNLRHLPCNASLVLQSSDSFRCPGVEGKGEERLLSYRVSQVHAKI